MSDRTPALYGGDPIREDWLGYGGQSITDREKEAVLTAIEGDYITRGPTVERFEQRVADLIGVEHAIATTSGTTALHLAGEAAGFGPGDEVIITPLTFVASAFPAIYTGAEPVLADIEPERRTLDPDTVRSQLTENTAGLVPMHYGGHPADIEGLLEIADDHDLTVIWDACHAFGGSWQGEPIGAQRDMAVFSFHPVKTITTGEGGMVVTDDDGLARRCRRLRSFDMEYNPAGHESEPWYQVTEGIGYNYNVTELQAALGLAQLDRLDEFKARRDTIIDQYNEAFNDIDGLRTPPEPVDGDPLYHLYALEVDERFGCDRQAFVKAMHAENIGVQVHYVPLHFHPLFQHTYGYTEDELPQTNMVYEKLVSLPLFSEMTQSDVQDVVRAIRALHDYHVT